MMSDRRLRERSMGRRGQQRRFQPAVAPLETRSLLSINTDLTTIIVQPAFLPNTPDGRQMTVAVTGALASNHTTTPSGFFFVTDQYGADEPRGGVALKLAGPDPKHPGWFLFSFSFDISLQARRSTHTGAGRQYVLFVGGTDADGAGGREVSILVPKNFAAAIAAHTVTTAASAAKASHPNPAAHGHKAR
jgi:hypothetical protein